MKAMDARVGQLLKTNYGLVTLMKFWAPACVACIVVSKGKKDYTEPKVGEWLYLRGLDFEEAEIIA